MTNGTTTTKNDHPSDKPLRPKYYRYLVYLGLLLYTAGLFILAVAPRFDLAKGGIIFWYVSGFGILIGGLIVLWLQNRTFWPEVLGVSVIVFAIFIFTFDNTGQEDRKLVLQRVPVAAEKVSGGVGGLAPEQAVGIVVYAPNASSTRSKPLAKLWNFLTRR